MVPFFVFFPFFSPQTFDLMLLSLLSVTSDFGHTSQPWNRLLSNLALLLRVPVRGPGGAVPSFGTEFLLCVRPGRPPPP